MVLALLWVHPADAVDTYASLEYGQKVLQVDGVPVSEYCKKFATIYSENHVIDYHEHSARIKKKSAIKKWFSN